MFSYISKTLNYPAFDLWLELALLDFLNFLDAPVDELWNLKPPGIGGAAGEDDDADMVVVSAHRCSEAWSRSPGDSSLDPRARWLLR